MPSSSRISGGLAIIRGRLLFILTAIARLFQVRGGFPIRITCRIPIRLIDRLILIPIRGRFPIRITCRIPIRGGFPIRITCRIPIRLIDRLILIPIRGGFPIRITCRIPIRSGFPIRITCWVPIRLGPIIITIITTVRAINLSYMPALLHLIATIIIRYPVTI